MNEGKAIIQYANKLAYKHPEDIIAVYGMDETCIWASPSHESILGYAQDEMVGYHWKDMVAPDYHEHAQLVGSDAFLNGRSIEFGVDALTRDGQRVPLRGRAWLSMNPVTDVPVMVFQARIAANPA